MKPNLKCRMISAVLMGILLGSYIHNDYVKWGQRGREAFIAYQTQRFDQHMANPHPTMVTIIASILFVVVFLAVYEILAYIISRIVGSPSGDQIAR